MSEREFYGRPHVIGVIGFDGGHIVIRRQRTRQIKSDGARDDEENPNHHRDARIMDREKTEGQNACVVLRMLRALTNADTGGSGKANKHQRAGDSPPGGGRRSTL